MLCFCVFVIPFGYEDADDRAALRIDLLLKLALNRAPVTRRDLWSQPLRPAPPLTFETIASDRWQLACLNACPNRNPCDAFQGPTVNRRFPLRPHRLPQLRRILCLSDV